MVCVYIYIRVSATEKTQSTKVAPKQLQQEDYHGDGNKPDMERQMIHVLPYKCELKLKKLKQRGENACKNQFC